MTKNLKEISEAVRLYDILNKKQDKVVCRFIGGCVRDQILSREIKDIDLSTSLLPDQVKDLLSKEVSVVTPISFVFPEIFLQAFKADKPELT